MPRKILLPPFLIIPILLELSCLCGCAPEVEVHTGEVFHPADSFYAVGIDIPEVEYLKPGFPVPRELERISVEVYFDLLPTRMRFSMPCYPCMVTENNIHYSNGWTETYDPRASSSCEILWDREARTARMWIESQNDARIIVRFRGAIADPDGYIAHSNIPSGSPYGEGDWTDEWYYIYPDGMHTRHVRIYTGLAGQSLTVTDELFDGIAPMREIPPMVVHEFHEEFVFGQDGRLPEDDISSSPLTLIKMDGREKIVSYKPYPKDYGEFADANIKLVNLRSRFRPYTIFMPYGLENEPYPPEGELPHIVQTWPRYPKDEGYSASIGHSLNWWHYRRTETILEQVYLAGMTAEKDPQESLIDLAGSWLRYPRLIMEGRELSYTDPSYDQAQRAYVIPRLGEGPEVMSWQLGFPPEFEEDETLDVNILNPAFVVPDWGDTAITLSVNDEVLRHGEDFRYGFEEDMLVIWCHLSGNEQMNFTLSPEITS